MDEQLRLLVFLLFFGGRLLGQGKMLASCNGGIRFCRQTGANFAGVRAALQGKMLAPRNGGTRLCRQWGANAAGVRPRSRAKCWRLATEAQGFAGKRAPTLPVSEPPFPIFRPGVGAQTPAKPCSFVPFAPSLRTFSALGRRLESRKGEWPRPFSFSSFPQ